MAWVLLLVPAAATGGHGSAFVTTLPPAANVWMDGNYLGDTPLFIDGLDGGRHYLTLTHAGWQPQHTAIDVTVGQVTTVSAVLITSGSKPSGEQPKGTLSIRGAAGAKVFVDGMALASPYDAQPVVAGDHILLVQRGATKTTSSVRIYPNTTTTVSLSPRATGAGQNEQAEVLVALDDYVPKSDYTVSGDEIAIHHNGFELECAVGSLNYILNGREGTLAVAPAMVGGRPYLPRSLLDRIAGTKPPGH